VGGAIGLGDDGRDVVSSAQRLEGGQREDGCAVEKKL
jgi:hypothetical protein